MSTYAPFAKPLYVMLKPVGAVCNLACDYCYYLEKSKLYQNNPKHVMSEELLEKFIEEYINSQTMPQVMFTWHGGETLMRPLSFYKKAMELLDEVEFPPELIVNLYEKDFAAYLQERRARLAQ